MINSLKHRVFEFVFRSIGRMSRANRMRLGAFLTWVGRPFLKRRSGIIKLNLKLCFPEASQEQRELWYKQHLRALSQTVIDRGMIWYGTREQITEEIDLLNFEIIQNIMAQKKPLIVLGPHFVALDMAATRMTMIVDESATIYKAQSDPAIDEIVKKGRARFNATHLIARSEGVRGMLRYLKKGAPVYYLPDMDFGRHGAVFVPFFGIPAATLPTTAVLARKWNATIVPVISRWHADTGKYTIDVRPPLEDFPGDETDEEATARLNRLIEEWVREDPPQYYWVHRRFKTRPTLQEPKYY